jgi:ankyrin repeat protein
MIISKSGARRGEDSDSFLLDPIRIDVLGWTDAHQVAYGSPILIAGQTVVVPSSRARAFLEGASDDFLCQQNDFGQTALHLAARQDNNEIVSLHVERTLPCLSVGNRDGDTPLHYAAAWGRAISAQILAKGGADISARNNKGRTPLDDSLSFGHKYVLSLINAACETPKM